MSLDDGFNANLSDKTKMSTGALINFVSKMAELSNEREEAIEIRECLDELVQRHVINAALKQQGAKK